MKIKHRISMKAAVIAVVLLASLSCGKDRVKVDFDYGRFKKMRAAWEDLNISNYSFTYSFRGFGCWSNRYTVAGDSVTATEHVTSDCPFYSTGDKYTIDDVFRQIEHRYKDPYLEKVSNRTYFYCSEIVIEYDTDYYFPKQFEFIYEGRNMDVTDTENVQTVTDFTVSE
jgi:hypothetical protein